MISNLYFWIFPAAVFTAAAFSNFSFMILRKKSEKNFGSISVVWIFLNLSIAFIFFIGSVFFVNWKDLTWDWSYISFFLVFLIAFYFGFIFKLIVGIPLLFSLTVIIMFFTMYFSDWNPVPTNGEVAQYRILSTSDRLIKAELYGIKKEPLFVEGSGNSINLKFSTLKTNSVLFFIKPDLYYKWFQASYKTDFFENIVNFLTEKTFFLSKENYSVVINKNTILYLYRIIFSPDNKKIIIEK